MLNHQIKSLLFIEYQRIIFIQQTLIKLENKKTLSIAGRRLINFYRGKWMKDFIIPEL